MEQSIKDYFNDFFTDIKVFTGNVNGMDAIGVEGYRNGNKYNFSTNQVHYDGEMLYHWLESIKGKIAQTEQTILLEKK